MMRIWGETVHILNREVREPIKQSTVYDEEPLCAKAPLSKKPVKCMHVLLSVLLQERTLGLTPACVSTSE